MSNQLGTYLPLLCTYVFARPARPCLCLPPRVGGWSSDTLPTLSRADNGDADACVPYKGNEEWISSLVKLGDLTEKDAWTPWYNDIWPDMPAGYVTTYNVTGAPTKDFSFLTIRLAGHMVPTFQPASSLSFFSRFLSGTPFAPDDEEHAEL